MQATNREADPDCDTGLHDLPLPEEEGDRRSRQPAGKALHEDIGMSHPPGPPAFDCALVRGRNMTEAVSVATRRKSAGSST